MTEEPYTYDMLVRVIAYLGTKLGAQGISVAEDVQECIAWSHGRITNASEEV